MYVTNSLTYSLCDIPTECHLDDHFQDLKRIIAAVAESPKGKCHYAVSYESRQHPPERTGILDCAIALKELLNMGVENIITLMPMIPRVRTPYAAWL
jgi:ribose-phosphate pyrophosphokinase